MGFDEGSLHLDRPDRTYYAGETVYATLQFHQEKPKSIRGIYVKVKGYAHTHWTTHHTRRDADGKTHSYTVSHDGHQDYFNSKQYIVGSSSGEYRFQPGAHKFSFQCPIPNNCPSSFEGEYGHIRYELKVVVDRAFKLDQEKKIGLEIIAPLDLNTIAGVNEPLLLETEESYCCWCMKAGRVETRVLLPAAGAIPGQRLPVEIACDNRSNVEIQKIKVGIKKDTFFYAHSSPGTRSGSRQTVAELQKGPVPSNSSRSWTVDLQLPDDVDPSALQNCSIIDLDYFLKVTIVPSGCHTNTDLEEKFVIGTEPLRAAGAPAPPAPAPQHTFPSYSAPDPFAPYPGANQPYPNANQPYPGTNQPYLPNSSTQYPNPPPPYSPNAGPYPTPYQPPPYAYPEKSERPPGAPQQGTAGGAAAPPLPYPVVANMPLPHNAGAVGRGGAGGYSGGGGRYGGGGSGATAPPAPDPFNPSANGRPDVGVTAEYAFNPSVVPPEKQ